MRPLQLSFSGIRSYAGQCGPLDFTGKNMVGILGDTGAGKSTILEAITFALYGNSSWSGAAVAPLVADGATAMSVDFIFLHDGQRWRVRRTFHANTTPTSHLLENLDTGEEVDNARAVNRRIASLLNLTFDGFQAAVLLPQGRFDQLLNATGRDRTMLLKGIFGTQVIETMRERATEHREQLAELLNDARLARRDLLPDPEVAAAEARLAAEQAEQRSAQLTETLNTLLNIQQEAARMRARGKELEGTIGELDHRRIANAGETIEKLKPVEQRLAQETATLESRKQTATTRHREANTSLMGAEAQGLTLSSLTSADTVLSGLPARLADLAEDREAIAHEEQRLTDEKNCLATTDAELTKARTAAAERRAVSDVAVKTVAQTREAVRQLRDCVATVLGETVALARSSRDAEVAEQKVLLCRSALPQLRTAVEEAESALAIATQELEIVRHREAAHLVGADLSAGDPCPVCTRSVPSGYQAPEALDPQALQTAQRTQEAKARAHRTSTKALDQAETQLTTADEFSAQRNRAAEAARARMEQAREVVRQAAHSSVWPRTDTPLWDRSAFTSALDIAITTLGAGDPDEVDRLRADTLTTLLEPAETFEQALTLAAESACTITRTAENEADLQDRSVRDLRRSYEEATERAARAKQRHASAESHLRSDLDSLPDIARETLSADNLWPTKEEVAEARRAVSERLDGLNLLIRARDNANTELKDVAEQYRALDQRHLTEVMEPLYSLLTGLGRWAEAIQDAARRTSAQSSLPDPPENLTTKSAAHYAVSITQSAATVHAALHSALNEITARTGELIAELMTQVRATRDSQVETVAATTPPENVDPLDTALFDPLKDAATTSRNEAHRMRVEQATAESQIEPARALDAAIKVGAARYTALDKLRALLAEAKFQQYLIDQRTQALLGLASELFGELSGGQFGFGADFQVVSRASNASRSPKTLSGGETFLASLALALALVDLYSRAGARLGALFLDEGFGSLDVDTLARALAVLRSETGGDKLVTVISHLHAVAEAVEDVLWVERLPTGSIARWLDADERDALVREDVSAGLLNLA